MAIQCAEAQTSTLAKLAPPHTAAYGLAVVLPGGRRIEVHPDFDTNTFERLVSALERVSAVFGLGPATRIYLAAGVTDMRKGFEGLYGLVRDRLSCEPLSGQTLTEAACWRGTGTVTGVTAIRRFYWHGTRPSRLCKTSRRNPTCPEVIAHRSASLRRARRFRGIAGFALNPVLKSS